MKAIILAAGKGERLGAITKDMPKPMLKVKGEVILEHNLIWLKKYGIKDIYINLHYLPQMIRGYFGSGNKYGIKIRYSYEPKILGTAGAVRKIAKGWNKPFIVVYGDNYYPMSYNIKNLCDCYSKSEAIAVIGLYKNNKEVHKSGVVILNRENIIAQFKEKPACTGENLKLRTKGLINTGVYILDNKIIDYIPRGYCDFGRDVFPRLLDKGVSLAGYVFKKSLTPIDTVRLYERAIK